MKKRFFTMVVMTLLLLSIFGAQQVQATQTEEEELLTLTVLRKISSWEELTELALPTLKWKLDEDYEDYEVARLVSMIEEYPQTIPAYHDAKYVNIGFAGTINCERLKKYQAVIDVYNKSEELQLALRYKTGGIIYVESINDMIDLHPPIRKIGQKAILKMNTTYWESAYRDGSGNVSSTTKDQVVKVNGFAYLDNNRKEVVETLASYFN